jgi:GNAT superfamily N-acetyltransferase
LIAKFPQGCVQVLSGDETVGQLVMSPRAGKPSGYVGLFYLVPEMRGGGAGDALHEYVVAVSAGMGIQKLELNVSPTNGRAFAYYRKHGWRDLGPQPGHEEVHRMELVVRHCSDS